MPINYRFIPQDKEKVDEAAVLELNKALDVAKNKNQNVLLLLSGGSALVLLDKIDFTNLSSKVTISPLDERYSQDQAINNMFQIMATDFYQKAKEKDCLFIDTRVKNDEAMGELAERFDKSLQVWFNTYPQGIVIATLGIGPDGHISGMMPYPEDPIRFDQMFNQKNFVTAYDAGNKNPYSQRVTTTITFLRKINVAIVYAVGESKINALEKLKTEGSLADTPARILNELKDSKVFLFTDQKV